MGPKQDYVDRISTPKNTADRKLRPNTQQGAVDTCAAFRPPGTKFGHFGPKGPIYCQIWNGFKSIGSVFGSSVQPNASCVSQNGLKSAQRESKWLKMAQNRPKMAQSGVNMAQSGSKWPPQNGPKMGVTEHFEAILSHFDLF